MRIGFLFPSNPVRWFRWIAVLFVLVLLFGWGYAMVEVAAA